MKCSRTVNELFKNEKDNSEVEKELVLVTIGDIARINDMLNRCRDALGMALEITKFTSKDAIEETLVDLYDFERTF